MKTYWIAVNSYRTFVSSGFSNTWKIYRCTRKEQKRILENGLLAQNGYLSSRTTHGIRLATNFEIKKSKQEIERFGESSIQYINVNKCY